MIRDNHYPGHTYTSKMVTNIKKLGEIFVKHYHLSSC